MESRQDELNFIDWESRVFGAGYGSGELPILKSLKVFFESFDGNNYDFQVLENKLGDTVTWLLINSLSKHDVIEWGTSARYGWIAPCGEFVRDFIKNKSPEELYEILMTNEDSICLCDGEITGIGHENCGKNPMVNEKYADKLKYNQ